MHTCPYPADQYIKTAGISDYRKSTISNVGKNNSVCSTDVTLYSDDDEDMIDLESSASEYFGKPTMSDLPKLRSQQWRLLPPNIQADRPAGMPPLVPASVVKKDDALCQQKRSKSVQDLTIEVDNNACDGKSLPKTPGWKKYRKWTYNQRNRQHQHNNGDDDTLSQQSPHLDGDRR